MSALLAAQAQEVAALRAEASRLTAQADRLELEVLERDGQVWEIDRLYSRSTDPAGTVALLVEQRDRSTGQVVLRTAPDDRRVEPGDSWLAHEFEARCIARVEKVIERPTGSLWREWLQGTSRLAQSN